MQVIARQNDRLLITLFDESGARTLDNKQQKAVVLDLQANTVSPSLPYQMTLKGGYWEPATMPEAELYQRLAAATHQSGRDGTPARDLLSVGIK
jgi:hypothetical protein